MSRLLGLVLLSVFGLFLAACASSPLPDGGPLPADEAYEYRLGPNDKVRVTVFGEENLSGEFTVAPSGKISYPLVGEVDAAGKTVGEFQTALQTRLAAGYLTNPRVAAEVMTFRPFYILGEVNKPGEYPFVSGMTVLNAVATAQGFTYRADQRRVFIRRAGESAERAYALTTTTPVRPGDTVRVGERWF